MNRSKQIESSIAIAVDGVTHTLKHRIDQAMRCAEEEAYKPVSPMLKTLSANHHLTPDVVSHAAFAEILFIVQQSTISDGDLDFRELDLALSLLKDSKWRWFRGYGEAGSGYESFERLNNAETFARMIMHWQTDKAFLGGDFARGAIRYPFTMLAAVTGIATKSTSLLATWTQVIHFISSMICDLDGLYDGEADWLDELHALGRAHVALAQSFILQEQIREQKESLPKERHVAPLQEQAPSDDTTARKAALAAASEQLHTLIGVTRVKAEVASLTNFLNIREQRIQSGLPVPAQALHFVFTGNPGTGKTTIARIISKILYGFGILKTARFVEADRSALVGGYVGQTAIKTSDVIDQATNGVLFIDEAYSLSQDDSGQDYGREAVDTLLKRMEDLRDRLVVIVAGYPREMTRFISSNPGLQSRFTRFIHFDDYTPSELCRIFEKLCEEAHYKVTAEARANLAILCNLAHAQRTEAFGNARFVRNIFESTLSNHANRLAESIDPVTKETLATLEASDLPYSVLKGVAGPFDVNNSKWQVQCPGCSRVRTAGIALIGNRVTCACGSRFRCPWWNLVPDSVPGLTNFAPSDRPEDLVGFDAVAATPPKAKR
jgi:AAA+ superfamily predicted ATPase